MTSLASLEHSSTFSVTITMSSGISPFTISFCFFVSHFSLAVSFSVDSYLHSFRARIGVLGGTNGKDLPLFELLASLKHSGDAVTGELHLGVDSGEDRGEFSGV